MTDVYDEKYISNQYNLLQNYPNPFNPSIVEEVLNQEMTPDS
jgi:hypothetical protein